MTETVEENALVVQTESQALAMVEQAYTALCAAVDFQQARQVQNAAIAAAAYAREAKDTRLLERATELRTRAQRKAGEMLAQSAETGDRAGKVDGGKRAAAVRWGSTSIESTRYAPTLAEIGISKDQSSQWQKLAALPDADFESALATTKQVSADVSASKVIKAAKALASPGEDETPAPTRVIKRRPDKQSRILYGALEDLSSLTMAPFDLFAGLDHADRDVVGVRLDAAIALLQRVKESWTVLDVA